MSRDPENQDFVCFFVATLAVANYPLDLAWSLKDRLRAAGLCDPLSLAKLSRQQIVRRLTASGYDRGAFMAELLASRFQSIAAKMTSLDAALLREALRHGDHNELRALFLSAKGVGPTVIKNFLLLRGL
jgi:hypothetical protein